MLRLFQRKVETKERYERTLTDIMSAKDIPDFVKQVHTSFNLGEKFFDYCIKWIKSYLKGIRAEETYPRVQSVLLAKEYILSPRNCVVYYSNADVYRIQDFSKYGLFELDKVTQKEEIFLVLIEYLWRHLRNVNIVGHSNDQYFNMYTFKDGSSLPFFKLGPPPSTSNVAGFEVLPFVFNQDELLIDFVNAAANEVLALGDVSKILSYEPDYERIFNEVVGAKYPPEQVGYIVSILLRNFTDTRKPRQEYDEENAKISASYEEASIQRTEQVQRLTRTNLVRILDYIDQEQKRGTIPAVPLDVDILRIKILALAKLTNENI